MIHGLNDPIFPTFFFIYKYCVSEIVERILLSMISIYLSIHPSIHLSIYLSIYIYHFYLFFILHIVLHTHTYIYIYIYISYFNVYTIPLPTISPIISDPSEPGLCGLGNSGTAETSPCVARTILTFPSDFVRLNGMIRGIEPN